MRKKTICAMMTGFLAVQGIEVHAETQQTTGEAASAVESVELEAEIIENSDVTDADGKAGPEELLPDEKSEEEPPIEEKPEQEPEPPEEKTDPAETGKKETEGEEKMLPPTVIPDPEKEPAERWEEEEKEISEDSESGKPEELPEAGDMGSGESESEEGCEETDTKESETEESDSERTDFGEMDTEKPDYEDTGSEKSGTENLMPEDPEPEKPDMEETKQEFAKREPTENDLDEEEAFNSAKKTILIKIDYDRETDEQLPVAAATPEEVTQDPDDIPLQTEESSPPPAETPSESAGEEPSQIRPQIIADFVLSQIADEDFEAPIPLIIRPADTSVEIDPGYTPEILLEGAADTAEILSCMVNGSEAEYEWKENKICLKAESLSEGYNRITVKVCGADGIVRTMKPWEVNVKPKTSTLVSQRTSQKPKGTRLWQSLRRLWNLVRAIAEIQNQTTRYLRALCRK